MSLLFFDHPIQFHHKKPFPFYQHQQKHPNPIQFDRIPRYLLTYRFSINFHLMFLFFRSILFLVCGLFLVVTLSFLIYFKIKKTSSLLFLLMHGLQQQLFFILFYNTLNIILMTKQLTGQFLLFIMIIQLMEQHQQCLSLYYCLFFLLKLYLKKLK